MQSVIVAAGRGSRMGSATNDKPKCFVEFQGRSLISWQINVLKQQPEIKNINLVRGYMGQYFDTLPFKLKLYDNPRWETTNMVASLMCAREILCSGDDILVSYGDIIYESRILRKILTTEGDIVVSVDKNWLELWSARNEDPLLDAESLSLDNNNHVLDIGQKVDSIKNIEAQYMGLILFRNNTAAQLVDFYENANIDSPWLLGRTLDNCYMTDILRGLIDSNVQITAAPITGGWLEFDTNDDLTIYNAMTDNGTLNKLINLEA